MATFGTEGNYPLLKESTFILTSNNSATGFSKAFPGIIPHLLTLTSNFHIPIYRDLILAQGICSVSKQACSSILRRGPGSAITIVVGGAAESLNAHPGTADLTLKRRLGFIKVAIQHGFVIIRLCYSVLANHLTALILCQCFHSARMMCDTFRSVFKRVYLLTLFIRFTSRCQTRKAQLYMIFRSVFNLYLDLLCLFFTVVAS